MVLDESMLRRHNALKEMMDLARFIVSDGEVTETEAQIFSRWLERNPDMLNVYPVSEMVVILRATLADGHLSDREKSQLMELIGGLAGS